MLLLHEGPIHGCRPFVLQEYLGLHVHVSKTRGDQALVEKVPVCNFRDHVRGWKRNLLHVLLVAKLFSHNGHTKRERERERENNNEYHSYILAPNGCRCSFRDE